MIDRDVEEALNLRGMQVERQDAIGAGGADQIGNEFRSDRHARLVLAVLPRVAVVRQHGRDAARRGALEGVEHDQKLEQVVVHRRRGRLDDEDVRAAHVLVDLHVVLAVGEAVERDAALLDAEARANLFRERRMGATVEDLQRAVQAGGL